MSLVPAVAMERRRARDERAEPRRLRRSLRLGFEAGLVEQTLLLESRRRLKRLRGCEARGVRSEGNVMTRKDRLLVFSDHLLPTYGTPREYPYTLSNILDPANPAALTIYFAIGNRLPIFTMIDANFNLLSYETIGGAPNF